MTVDIAVATPTRFASARAVSKLSTVVVGLALAALPAVKTSWLRLPSGMSVPAASVLVPNFNVVPVAALVESMVTAVM